MNDPDRGIYTLVAAILPPLLGLGLIELYVSRGVSFVTVAAGMLGLALVMVVIAALADLTQAARRQPRRSRRSRGH